MYKQLLSGGLWLCCVACQSPQQVKREAVSSPRLATPARVAAPPLPAKPVAKLELLVIGDSIGPRPVEVSDVGQSALRLDVSAEGTSADTINKRFLVIDNLIEVPRLLYRANAVDTLWRELTLFDHYESGAGQRHVAIQEADLDGRGRPEVLITYSSANYGSGGGSTYASSYLLDMTPLTPLLLLQAQTSQQFEWFGAYAIMHGVDLDPQEANTGYDRRVVLRHHELLLGAVKTYGNSKKEDSPLTNLAAGHYRYQQGRMYRVKKVSR
jgi:hypothetical protein